MCLILFGFQVSGKYPLIIAANRDEFYHRPTAPMQYWNSNPGLLAGRDLEKGGTWFGVTKKGRFAALTNFRDPASVNSDAPSRGEIIPGFLTSNHSLESYGDILRRQAGVYNGYNLLFGSKDELFWFSNVKKQVQKVEPGIHGLSNGHLDTPWPKVERGKSFLKRLIHQGAFTPDLLSMLTDQALPVDDALPDTGIGIRWERRLSSVFIQSQTYGTRASTIMKIDVHGTITVCERTYDQQNPDVYSDKHFEINRGLAP